MRILCEQMVSLAQVDIVHRDIRPSNIVFGPVGLINEGRSVTSNSNSNNNKATSNLINESISGDRFYRLFNLESARMVDRAALLSDDDEDDVFTVKGSSVFT